ncbi:MAG: hypothetical protein H6741_00945 [Alphaproteobacteria bacterium]|nr:hypothetical protein [Alphaproteobacteria bacterium]
MHRLTLIAFAAGCSGAGQLEISPNPVTWGVIDFHQIEPVECDFDEGGCEPTLVRLENVGAAELSLEIPGGHDGETVCIRGWEPGEAITLDPLAPGAYFNLELVVCGYPAGALDTEVTGSYAVRTNDGAGSVPLQYAYTPTRDQGGGDSGF